MLIFRFENESGKIDYHSFLSGINWRENASIPLPPDAVMKVSEAVNTTEVKFH